MRVKHVPLLCSFWRWRSAVNRWVTQPVLSYGTRVCLRAHKQSTYTIEDSSYVFLHFPFSSHWDCVDFSRFFLPHHHKQCYFSPPLNCHTISEALGLCALAEMVFLEMLWCWRATELIRAVCVSAAGHRGQWHPEWSTGQAEQRPGRAEQHLRKHVSVYISYTHGWITRKRTL